MLIEQGRRTTAGCWENAMGVVPFSTSPPHPSVVFALGDFALDRQAVRILNPDERQFADMETDCNASYDLRVGDKYKDHRNDTVQALNEGEYIVLLPGNAVIIQTEEEVQFPLGLFGQILPRVTLLARGIANTPSKIDPGYNGHLLITTFNHGKRTEKLRRGERFCSLHLLTVEDGVRPFNKASKQLGGLSRFPTLQRWGDWLEVRQIWINFGLLALALVSVILSVVAIVHELGQSVTPAVGHGG
jgi:dCTP deaminase